MSKSFTRKALAAALLSFCMSASASSKVTQTNLEEVCNNWTSRISYDLRTHLYGRGTYGPDKSAHEVSAAASRITVFALNGTLEQIRKAFPGFYETALVVVVEGLREGEESSAFQKRLHKECMAIPVS